jgi:hypothetical protein
MDAQAPSKLDRRSFFKRAGIGSIALGPLPGLLAATPAGARGRAAGFNFTAISRAGTIGSVVHAVNMAGSGTIEDDDVEGGGHFQHYDLASAPPRTIIAAGAWRARRLVSFDPIGTWGVITAGVLVARIQLRQTIPSPAVVAATLEVVCNVGSAGLDTGQPEGFTLTVPGAPFGAFVPIEAGITVFTTIAAND